MIELLIIGLAAVAISGVILFFILLGLGLCRAAAYAPDVVEDIGEYE